MSRNYKYKFYFHLKKDVIQLFNMFKFILIDNLKYSVKCEKIMSKRDKLELLIANIEK